MKPNIPNNRGIKMQINAFGQSGVLITDPKITLWLCGHEDEKFGTNDGYLKVKEVIEWLVMSVLGIKYGDVKKYCQENNPILVFETSRGQTVESYNGVE
jgi:hypothetical protein